LKKEMELLEEKMKSICADNLEKDRTLAEQEKGASGRGGDW